MDLQLGRDEKKREARHGLRDVSRDALLTLEFLESQEHKRQLDQVIDICEKIDKDLDSKR